MGKEGLEAGGLGNGDGQILEHMLMISDYSTEDTGEFVGIVADAVEVGGDGKDVFPDDFCIFGLGAGVV